MHGVYEEDIKRQIMQKVLNRKNGVTITEIASGFGVSLSTINRWRSQMSKAKSFDGQSKDNVVGASEKAPEDWSAFERFEVIMQSQGLDEVELSAF